MEMHTFKENSEELQSSSKNRIDRKKMSDYVVSYYSQLRRNIVPKLDAWIKLTSITDGRDKIYRTVQYFGQFLVWYFSQKGDIRYKVLIIRIKRLSEACSQGRKLFRFGKFLELFRSCAKISTMTNNSMLQYGYLGKNICLGNWLLLDALQWLNYVGVLHTKSLGRINKYALLFWFMGLSFSLGTHLYQLKEIYSKNSNFHDKKSKETHLDKIKWNFLRDLLDIFIPASSLGYFRLESGVVGLIGTTTSLMSMYELLEMQKS
jgi:peroxin-11B